MKMRALVYVALGVLSAGPALAQSFSGDIGVTAVSHSFEQSDDDIGGVPFGFAGSGHVAFHYDAWRVLLDFNHLKLNTPSEEYFDDFAPGGATAYGVHVGGHFANTYIGGFIGRNRFQGDDAPSMNGFLTGKVMGVEAEHQLSFGSVFGQIGQAEMIGDGAGFIDSGFDGRFYRLGVAAAFGQLDLIAAIETGKSPDFFEDEGDWGSYRRVDLIAEYPLSERIIGSIGYHQSEVVANTEDHANASEFTFGIRVPFGENRARNNLGTSYMPGLAAAWAETLD